MRASTHRFGFSTNFFFSNPKFFYLQITSILAGSFKENSAAGFAIFKFMQSLSCAIAFFYSPWLTLQWQLLITVILDIVGAVTFCLVEWEARKRERDTQPEDTSCAIPGPGGGAESAQS